MKDIKMKIYRFNITLILVIVAKFCFAQFDDTKRIVRSFPLKDYTQVEISNKYGIVHINTWDKDSIRIEVQIDVISKNIDKLNRTMENVDIDFINTDYYVNVKTIFVDNSRNLLSDFTQTFFESDATVKINYTVYMPAKTDIEIDNKYGDIYCGNLNGDVKMSLSYGKLRANKFSGKTSLDLRTAKASINEIKKGSIICYYSELTIESAEILDIDSHDSNIEIEKIEGAKIVSRRDNYNFTRVSSLDIDGSFTDLKIGDIKDKIYATLKYGGLYIKDIHNSFSTININSKYTDLRFYFNSSAVTYNVDIVHKNSRIIYPKDISNLNEKLIDLSDKRYRTVGKVGTQVQTNSNLFITCDFGEIALFHK